MQATAGVFCPRCRVFHPSEFLQASPQVCPSCGQVLSEFPLTADASGWYYARGGRVGGPYSLSELQLMAAIGDLRPTDMLWQGESGRPSSAIRAKVLLASDQVRRPRRMSAKLRAAERQGPPWAGGDSVNPDQFLFVPGPAVGATPSVIAPTRDRGSKAWLATGLVAVLVLGLTAVRPLLDQYRAASSEHRPEHADSGGAGKNASQARAAASAAAAAQQPAPGTSRFEPLLQRGKAAAPAKSPPAKSDPSPGNAPPASRESTVLGRVHCTAGWATFGQVLPQGAAHGGVQLGNLPTQTDVKTRWPDGSIRFAVVTAQVPAAGAYTLKSDPATTDFFSPKWLPGVWAYFVTGPDGKEYTATISGKPEEEFWLCGPLVCEVRYTVAPRDAEGAAHPFLRVLFDLRVYKDGQSRADITVENTLNTPGATAEEYTIAIGDETGKVLYSRSGVTHYYLTRWRHVLGAGMKASRVVPDFEPAFQAKALPRYLSLVTAQVNAAAGERFDGLGSGDLSSDMSAHGGRPELAPYPDWTARYLVHKDPRQGRYVLVNGDLAGSWPVHLRKPDGDLLTIDEFPQFWLDPRAEPQNRPAGDLGATGPLMPDVAHQPSLAYVPYLVTGDRYYADEMAFWANYILLATFQDATYNGRDGSKGLLYSHEVRGIGWGLRNLADAAAYLPDNHRLKKYFAQKVMNNLAWLDEYADGMPTPLGTLWHDRRPENGTDPPYLWIALWEHTYLAWGIDHANKQGFVGGLKHRDRIARFQLKLFTSGKDYPRELGAPYLLKVGEKDEAGKVKLYESVAELYKNNFEGTGLTEVEFAGYYGPGARLMLLIALENGWPGAKQAHDFLWPKLAVEPHIDGQPGLALRAGWAITP